MAGPPAEQQKKQPAADNDAAMQVDPAAAAKAGEPKKLSTPVAVTARYEDVPGASKTGPQKAPAESALWFDPLTIASTSPHGEETEQRVGVSKGGGQTVAHFNAPLHDEGPAKGEGNGLLTAQLKYASDINTSYVVKLEGTLSRAQREHFKQQASQAIAKELNRSGDLDAVQAHVAEGLIATGAPQDIKVTITPISSSHSLSDAGRSHVAFKARSKPVIGLSVPLASSGERTITNSGSTATDQGNEGEVEGHLNTTHDHVHVDDTKNHDTKHNEGAVQTDTNIFHENNQRTYDEVVTKIESTVTALTSKLVNKLTADDTYRDKDHVEYADEEFKFDDWTKHGDAHSEEGDKDKKNWAAWLEDGLGALQGIADIPVALGLPAIGPVLRTVSKYGLGVDLAKKGAGALAVRGTIHYKDSKEDGETKDTKRGNDSGHADRNRTVTSKNTDTLTRDLNQIGTQLVTSLKHTHTSDNTNKTVVGTDVKTQVSGGSSSQTDKDNYTKDANHTNSGGSAKARAHQNSRSTIEYSVTSKETTTRPYLDARIIDGDGEVSPNEFPSPDATKKP